MTPSQIEGLLVGLAAIVTPTLLMTIWLMWRELRATRELADYYCEQWEAAGRRDYDHNLDWSDW